jgi:hypothetical protein
LRFFEELFSTNPINTPSVEIFRQGNQAITRFYSKIKDEGSDFIFEAKLTLVGEGNAGKTSLIKRILDPKSNLPQSEKRTRGIEINDWYFKESEGKKYVAHIWDFGGQDVYYPVHRFFITENSVFVLLASTRQTHHNFDYWIPTIFQFGSKSPIILGQTCHEGNRVLWNDIGVFVGNSNFNIIKSGDIPYVEINLPNGNEGLKAIKEIIINQILNLPRFGKGVVKSWIPVRQLIAEKAKDTPCITFESFESLCKESNAESFNKIIDIEDCCKFLHDIGVVLWYSENEFLKKWVILQPEWAMNAVYRIIDDDQIQNQRGNIFSNDLI